MDFMLRSFMKILNDVHVQTLHTCCTDKFYLIHSKTLIIVLKKLKFAEIIANI